VCDHLTALLAPGTGRVTDSATHVLDTVSIWIVYKQRLFKVIAWALSQQDRCVVVS